MRGERATNAIRRRALHVNARTGAPASMTMRASSSMEFTEQPLPPFSLSRLFFGVRLVLGAIRAGRGGGALPADVGRPPLAKLRRPREARPCRHRPTSQNPTQGDLKHAHFRS